MQRDFVPVAAVFTQPWLILANPSAPYNNLKDLIDAARQAPGKLTWGYGANALELAAELFKQRAQIDITGVSYKGSGPAMNDLLGGHIMLAVDTMASSLPHIQAGKLKALAVTSRKPIAQLPNVPPIGDTLRGYEAEVWYGVIAPAGTQRTPSATSNGGGLVAGMSPSGSSRTWRPLASTSTFSAPGLPRRSRSAEWPLASMKIN